MKQENNPESLPPQQPTVNTNNKPPFVDSKEQWTILKQYQEIVDRAHTEIESVRTIYKWLISTLGAALTVIFAVGIYFTYKSSEDFKTRFREDFMALKETVEKRVDAELSKESIQTLINDKVSKRVDDIVDKLIEDKITTKITPKIEESDKKLKTIDNQLKDALKISKDIEEVSNLMLTFIKAQSDDSEAFEQLGRWGVDKSFPFSNISQDCPVK